MIQTMEGKHENGKLHQKTLTETAKHDIITKMNITKGNQLTAEAAGSLVLFLGKMRGIQKTKSSERPWGYCL